MHRKLGANFASAGNLVVFQKLRGSESSGKHGVPRCSCISDSVSVRDETRFMVVLMSALKSHDVSLWGSSVVTVCAFTASVAAVAFIRSALGAISRGTPLQFKPWIQGRCCQKCIMFLIM